MATLRDHVPGKHQSGPRLFGIPFWGKAKNAHSSLALYGITHIARLLARDELQQWQPRVRTLSALPVDALNMGNGVIVRP